MVKTESISSSTGYSDDSFFLGYVIGKKKGGGGGGGWSWGDDLLIDNWDFTSETPLVGKTHGATLSDRGITYDATGALFPNVTNSYISSPLSVLPGYRPIIEVKTGEMGNMPSGTNRRFIMGTTDSGFIYRTTGVWAFFSSNGGGWTDSPETDVSFFANSNIKVVIDNNYYWHIYKNGTLWWEPNLALKNMDRISIGSTSISIINSVIKSMSIKLVAES